MILKSPHKFGQALGYKDLEQIHSDWINQIWFNSKQFPLQAHRGAYKTSAVTIVGTIIYLLFNPNHRILICRKEQAGATSILTEISQHLRGEVVIDLVKEFYKHDFHLTVNSRRRINISLKETATKEPNIMAIGTAGSVTGYHFDKIITDDIITLKDRISGAEREKVKAFYTELSNVIMPGQEIQNVGTPWHKEDAFSLMPKPVQFPIGKTGIKTFTKAHINKLKETIPPDIYAINYQLKHIAGKNKLFHTAKFKELPDRWRPVGHIDKAYSGDDFVALTLMGKHDGVLHARGWLWRDNIINLYKTIYDIWMIFKCGTIYSEHNDDKKLASIELNKLGIPVKTYHESQNKHVKIAGYLYPAWKNINWSHDTDDEYISQIIEYEEDAKHDDAPDSASSLLREHKFDQVSAMDFYDY